MHAIAAWLVTLLTVAAPLAAQAQPVARPVSIGYLGNSSPSLESNLVDALREGLRQLGYVEGRNLIITYQWAQGHQERLAGLAVELVRLEPDVIVTAGTPGTLAAKHATQSIPIVAAVLGDPVMTGVVASLAKPGGNVTGFANFGEELEAKRLELLKQTVPRLSRVAVLLNSANPFAAIGWKSIQRAAVALGVKLQQVEVRGPDDVNRALTTIKAARLGALLVSADRSLLAYRAAIVHFVVKNRLPGMFPFREFAQEGGLMAYGPNYVDLFRRAATYVDRILKGAKPADLAVEQPTLFELVINLQAAKALGITIPPSVLARADQVLQ